ncbi:MAG: T9SS type A sorting domain-containing protein [Bacteroidales bacterium]|nr:T9SS type A sorting domain-containing protein [Bacteroidales bacterium]
MRKFTILLVLIAITTYAMSQVKICSDLMPQNRQGFYVDKTASSEIKATPVWTCTFEEETPIWTVSGTTDMPLWTISDQAGAPANWATETGFYMEYLGEYSETGNEVSGKWAWLDIVGPLLPGGSGVPQASVGESYIQFDNIDLTEVAHPKLQWYQLMRAFNGNWYDNYVDISIDGGVNWTNIKVNDEVPTYDYADLFTDLYIGDIAGNESNVSIRFRWTQDTDGGTVTVGYAWEIDDISIIENAAYDVKMTDARMNFFSYSDYTVPGSESEFHVSSHFGQIPIAQMKATNANCWFNFIVQNKGYNTVTPTVKVTVTNPFSVVVYEETLVGLPLAITEIDTLDLVETDFHMDNPNVGEYTVAYEVYIDGQTDEDLENNTFESIFNVTNDVYARDLDNINGRFGLCNYTAYGISEEMIGTTYNFVEDSEILSGDVFIDGNTTVGTSFQFQLLTVVDGAWALLTESPLYTVEEANLDTWMHCEFTDMASVTMSEEYLVTEVMAAVKIYYALDDDSFYIGTDNSTSYGDWGSYGYVLNSGEWGWYYGFTDKGLGIRINVPYVTDVAKEPSETVNIYPNPTTGTLNIENAEGCDVQILNMMGQVVENIENARMVNSVDMSKYANGQYFVKVINGNEVSTHKVNLMK